MDYLSDRYDRSDNNWWIPRDLKKKQIMQHTEFNMQILTTGKETMTYNCNLTTTLCIQCQTQPHTHNSGGYFMFELFCDTSFQYRF